MFSLLSFMKLSFSPLLLLLFKYILLADVSKIIFVFFCFTLICMVVNSQETKIKLI